MKQITDFILGIIFICTALVGVALVLSEVIDDNISQSDYIVKMVLIKVIGFTLVFISAFIYNRRFKNQIA
jgi:cell division protein FtsW (lipid II flippase)